MNKELKERKYKSQTEIKVCDVLVSMHLGCNYYLFVNGSTF